MRVAVVTAADEKYFGYLQGMISSLRRAAPASTNPRVRVLDVGLSESNKSWLAGHGATSVPARWMLPEQHFPDGRQKTGASKGFLPEYFPGYDIYLWIDADAWVQDWEAVQMLVQAAARHGCAAVPEADRAYAEAHGASADSPARSSFLCRLAWLQKGFGDEVARELKFYPIVNAGVFAARGDCELWTLWPRLLLEAVSRGVEMTASERFMMEQTAFNVALLKHIKSFARLPAWCNWTCVQAWPVIAANGDLLEAGYPHRRLGIVHPVGPSKRLKIPVKDGRGELVGYRTLLYPGPIDA